MIDNNKEKWILLLSCIGSTSDVIFKNQLDSLAKSFNILSFDYPGHGLNFKCDSNFTIYTIVESIISKMDELKISKISILSISLGTIISHKLILNYPERFETCIFVGAVIDFSMNMIKYLFKFFTIIEPFMWYKLYLKVMIKMIIPYGTDEKRRKKLYLYLSNINKKVIGKWLKIMADEIFFYNNRLNMKKISELKIKKVYLSGNKDLIFLRGLDNIYVNDYNLVYIINDAGHFCHIDKEEEFNNFIKSNL